MIIDAHVHLITENMLLSIKERMGKRDPRILRSLENQNNRIFHRDNLSRLKAISIKGLADIWIREMDKNKIEKAVFFPIGECLDDLKEFIDYFPQRFFGYAFLNKPMAQDAPELLERYIKGFGFKGLKLYPCIQGFHACDERLFPLYEKAEGLGIPITFHMGISTSIISDYRYTNPLDLQLVLKTFTGLKIIIAHFGAGMFRETLLISYHSPNLYVDTSGTNNWAEYIPEKLSLKDIFKRGLEVLGDKRIIFGTDTGIVTTEYRSHILNAQLEVLKSLELPQESIDNITHNNITEILGL